jgi:hypothetical protein
MKMARNVTMKKVKTMTTDYLQRILDNPATPREEYMWAWNIMQERTAQQHRDQHFINQKTN